jgi:hypothetical protein
MLAVKWFLCRTMLTLSLFWYNYMPCGNWLMGTLRSALPKYDVACGQLSTLSKTYLKTFFLKTIDFCTLFVDANAGMVSEGCGMTYTQLWATSRASFYPNHINAPNSLGKCTQLGGFLTARQYLYRTINAPVYAY